MWFIGLTKLYLSLITEKDSVVKTETSGYYEIKMTNISIFDHYTSYLPLKRVLVIIITFRQNPSNFSYEQISH